jgi:hypothetical protein
VDVGFGSVVVCYDLKYHKWLKYNLNYAFISPWPPSPWKQVFNGKLWLRFVLY